MVQLFEMLFNAIKIYTIPFFQAISRCAKRNTNTQHSGCLSSSLSHSHSTHPMNVRVCVYFIAFGKCEFSSIICVRIFSVFVDGGTNIGVLVFAWSWLYIIYILWWCYDGFISWNWMLWNKRTSRFTSLTTSRTSLLDTYKTKIHMLPMITRITHPRVELRKMVALSSIACFLLHDTPPNPTLCVFVCRLLLISFLVAPRFVYIE